MSTKSDAAIELCIPVLDEQAFYNTLLFSTPMEAKGDLLDGLTELSELECDPSTAWNSLVLYAGLLLRDYESLFSLSTSTEQNHDRAIRILSFFFDDRKAITNSYLRADTYWPDTSLPDTCGSCFRAFGLTSEGRYRLSCSSCQGSATRMAYERLMAMHRMCSQSTINASTLSQLIYKYYSSNGDSTWQMIKPTTTF